MSKTTHFEPYLSNKSAIHRWSPHLNTITFAELCSATGNLLRSLIRNVLKNGFLIPEIWNEMMRRLVKNLGCRADRVSSVLGFQGFPGAPAVVGRLPGQQVSPFGTHPFTPFHFPLQSVPAALLSFFFVLTSFQVVVNKMRVHQDQDTVQSSCSIKSNGFFLPQHFSRCKLQTSTWSHFCFPHLSHESQLK